MADEIRIRKILKEGNDRGFLVPKENSDGCLAEIINTANYFLFLIKKSEGDGLDNKQLETRTGLNLNTCRIYCRALERLGKISKSKDGTIVIWRFKE